MRLVAVRPFDVPEKRPETVDVPGKLRVRLVQLGIMITPLESMLRAVDISRRWQCPIRDSGTAITRSGAINAQMPASPVTRPSIG